MSIKFSAIVPHPIVIIPTIGTPLELRKTQETQNSIKKIAEIFNSSQIDTIILISPHGPIEYQQITINSSPTLFANFKKHNDQETFFSFENDLEAINSIRQECEKRKISLRLFEDPMLDHGATVPLYYFSRNSEKKLIHIAYSYPDKEINFEFGKALYKICNSKKQNFAIIASADLSHRLSFDSPLGFALEGPAFDKQLIENLNINNFKGVLEMDKKLVKNSGECGYLSIVILLAIIEQFNQERFFKKIKFKPLSYEGPFGTGYFTGYFQI